MTLDLDHMRQAMRLMQAGDLPAATRALQQRLGGVPAPAPAARDAAIRPAPGPHLEGEFRVVDAAPVRPAVTPGPRGGAVRERFASVAGELEYLLHVPAGLQVAGAPLLLMLHGCTQTPEDFARGTRMNQVADREGFVIAWPAQPQGRNPNRCWNWFRGSDQSRGQGEPAMLAGLAQHLVGRHGLDADRVYVAGLSAGGAMAAVLASTYPDVFAAIGVHSGLPVGMAHDAPSAFAAMRGKGGRSRPVVAAAGRRVPAIVFHGDSDTTVHPGNGASVIEQSLGDAGARAGMVSSVEQGTAAGRRATRTVHRTADGRLAAEHWLVHGAAHAWSGGDASGSHADPQGPDASAEMLRFFGECRRDG